MSIEEVFGSAPTSLTWLQETSRTVLALLYGLLMVRVGGRRIFGRWAALDLTVAILIGSHLSRAETGNAPLWGTLAAPTALFALHRVLAEAASRWPAVSRIIEGEPIVLARDGERVTGRITSYAARAAGLEHIGQSKLVVLEPSGKITVL